MAQLPPNTTPLPPSTIPSPNGYSKLAALMGAHPELANFRRFDALNTHNLLYLQAELVFLENKLRKCIELDNLSGHVDRALYDRDWQSLFESSTALGGNAEQWETALRVRRVLKDYSKIPHHTSLTMLWAHEYR
jgi:hypothetical protein